MIVCLFILAWVVPARWAGGGLLVGVEVLIGEGWSFSALLEGKESSAKMPNLLLSLNLIQASAFSSESMLSPDPEIIKLVL